MVRLKPLEKFSRRKKSKNYFNEDELMKTLRRAKVANRIQPRQGEEKTKTMLKRLTTDPELKKFCILLAVFLVAYFLPVEAPRFRGAVLESLAMLHSYAREHVLLCLVRLSSSPEQFPCS